MTKLELEQLRDTARRLDREEQADFMVRWFFDNYEDPVHTQPVDGGVFVWLVEECHADSELSDIFGGAVADEAIEKAVQEIEHEGWEWVRIADLRAFDEEAGVNR